MMKSQRPQGLISIVALLILVGPALAADINPIYSDSDDFEMDTFTTRDPSATAGDSASFPVDLTRAARTWAEAGDTFIEVESRLAVEPQLTLSFGSVPVGSMVERSFKVTNVGCTRVQGAVVPDTPFAVVGESTYNLIPGAAGHGDSGICSHSNG